MRGLSSRLQWPLVSCSYRWCSPLAWWGTRRSRSCWTLPASESRCPPPRRRWCGGRGWWGSWRRRPRVTTWSRWSEPSEWCKWTKFLPFSVDLLIFTVLSHILALHIRHDGAILFLFLWVTMFFILLHEHAKLNFLDASGVIKLKWKYPIYSMFKSIDKTRTCDNGQHVEGNIHTDYVLSRSPVDMSPLSPSLHH